MAPSVGYEGGCNTRPFTEDNAMKRFVARFESIVSGVLSGFDRLVFRGSLLPLMRPHGMESFLNQAGISLLDFRDAVPLISERVKEAATAEARRRERPIRYVESTATSKEDLARSLLPDHPVEEGLVCVLTAVEPCMSFEYHRSKEVSERGLRLRRRKCHTGCRL